MLVSVLALLLGAAQAQDLRVVGGQPAPQGAWPDAAGVIDRGTSVSCTGVLIAPTVALTASHCLDGSRITHVLLDTVDYTRGDGELVRVAEAIQYPSYWNNYDIAILILEEPAQTTPRLIAQGCVLEDYLYAGAPVAIVGYGALNTSATQYGTELMQAFTTVTDPECVSPSDGCQSRISPGGELIAGGNGTDSCSGDSGGPLYLLTEDIGTYLVGTTVSGLLSSSRPCGDGGIYARPDAVIDWIEAETGVQLPVPTCNRVPEPDNHRVQVGQGRKRTFAIPANDPDSGDRHTWTLVEPPVQGTATIDEDGDLTYWAPDAYLGEDLLWVTVTDDGIPPHTVDVRVTIEVVEHACGCHTGDLPGSAGLLGAVGLLGLSRRRRRASGAPSENT